MTILMIIQTYLFDENFYKGNDKCITIYKDIDVKSSINEEYLSYNNVIAKIAAFPQEYLFKTRKNIKTYLFYLNQSKY